MTTRGVAEIARVKLAHPLWTVWRDGGGLVAARGSVVVRAGSGDELDARLHDTEQPMSAQGLLISQYWRWQITQHPSGQLMAWWCSPDRTMRHLVAEPDMLTLLARLRAIGVEA